MEGGDKVRRDPTKTSGGKPYCWTVRGHRAKGRLSQQRSSSLWRGAGPNWEWSGGWLLSPNIVMPHRGSGVPKVTLCARADNMDSEGTMHMEGNLINGRGGSYLQGTLPLGPVGSLKTELME